MMWGDNFDTIQPAPLKRQCADCGRHEHLTRFGLCDQCQEAWDDEMAAFEEPTPPARSLYQGYTKP